jgi:hypothetical protein
MLLRSPGEVVSSLESHPQKEKKKLKKEENDAKALAQECYGSVSMVLSDTRQLVAADNGCVSAVS